MICPNCGFVNEDGVLFCDRCKADLDMPAAKASPSMNDPAEPIPLEPIALEPIGLEPIALEPVAPGAALLEEAPAIELEPAEPPPPPPIESTGELPALPATPPPIPPTPVPAGSPSLVVLRGQRVDVKYPLYPGKNYLGRTDDKPVDIPLEDQEAEDRIWTSRQHAVIVYENGALTIEDLNSLNGTFVNRN